MDYIEEIGEPTFYIGNEMDTPGCVRAGLVGLLYASFSMTITNAQAQGLKILFEQLWREKTFDIQGECEGLRVYRRLIQGEPGDTDRDVYSIALIADHAELTATFPFGQILSLIDDINTFVR